jgi:allantoinase
MIDLIIRNATVVNADGRQQVDVAVHDGRIVALGKGSILPAASHEVDAGGLYLLPGAIDSHVHVREPGRTEREDFATATRAAAVSGITMLCEMPISSPSVHNPQVLADRIAAVKPKVYTDFALYGAAAADNVADIASLANAGIIAFKTFRTAVPAGREKEFIGLCCPDPGDFYTVLQATGKTGLPAAIHAEDEYILARLARDLKAQNDNGPMSHTRARPPVVEEASVAQSIALARAANAWLHVVHVSSPYSVDLIRAARDMGIKVTCETCPPYLFLTDEDLEKHGPYAKTNPPVRNEELVEAMWQRVARGDIDIIGTDHSPFLASEKEVGWDNMWAAPPGAPGIEILVPLMLTAVAYGRISLERMVALISANTAHLFGMQGRKGVIAVGADADFMLIDLAAEGRIDVNTWESKSRVTARLWHGRQTRGAVVGTWVRGKQVGAHGKVVGEAGWGCFVAPNPVIKERPFF